MIMVKKRKTRIKQIILIFVVFGLTEKLFSTSGNVRFFHVLIDLYNQKHPQLPNNVQESQGSLLQNNVSGEYRETNQQRIQNQHVITTQVEDEGSGCADIITGFTICFAYMAIPICFIASCVIAGL